MFTSLLTVKYKATIETFLYKNNTRLSFNVEDIDIF